MSACPDPEASRRAGRRGTPLASILLLLSLLLPAASPLPVRAEDFSIRSFHADIEVRDDSSIRVDETVDVEFHRPRHGIFRDIPFRYEDDLGKATVMPVRVESVTAPSGGTWKFQVERKGGVIRVRIGDPDRYVDGRQVYVIRYAVENAIVPFPEHDELFWNVTGNDWPVPIGSASASVTFAAGALPATPRTRCFTGSRGSREEACRTASDPNRTTFSAERDFRAGEGMTVVLGWDKGIVRPPSRWSQFLFRVNSRENWPFLAIPLTLSFMAGLWYRKGKDPYTGDPLVVAYAPPEEGGRTILPAEAGTLIDERLDPADITASVVHLAVKGHVTIEEKKSRAFLFPKTDYLLRKGTKPEAELPPFERLLLERLFRNRGPEVHVSDLKLEFYTNLEDLRKAVFEGLECTGYFSVNPVSVKSRYVRAGFVFLAAAGLLALLGERLSGSASFRTAIALSLCGGIVILFAPLMPVKTRKGVKALGRVKGFEEFLTRAEKDRLERLNDPNLFEKYLPYAIALGVSDRWARAFDDIYQAPPRWYLPGSGAETFRPSVFHHSLDSALSTMSGAMVAAPRSSGSGFSGSGGSGGGGGGGGGGSW
ncbi:MAG: conserved rane protein of unknown function [Deltaproteobacteria bacterium]|nr:conserved rane protein of unknown function [Deltaproteobacteria bacterium]